MKKNFGLFTMLIVSCFLNNVYAEEQESSPPIYSIQMLSPQSEETFQNDAQSITVTVVIEPELQSEDKVVIDVDGNPATEPEHSTNIALPYLERGPHTLQAKIIQPKGQGAETNTITIYQQRTSRLLPAH